MYDGSYSIYCENIVIKVGQPDPPRERTFKGAEGRRGAKPANFLKSSFGGFVWNILPVEPSTSRGFAQATRALWEIFLNHVSALDQEGELGMDYPSPLNLGTDAYLDGFPRDPFSLPRKTASLTVGTSTPGPTSRRKAIG